MDNEFWHNLVKHSKDILMSFGMKLVYAIIVLIIGLFLIKLLRGLITKVMEKKKVDLSLQSFVKSLSSIVLYIFLFLAIGFVFGMDTTAFLGIFGAAGIAIGLALQGSLANFAGGVLILLFRPFKIGDKVIIDGEFGVVEEIDILYTRLKSYSGFYYIIPNGKVSNMKIENRAISPELRVQIELHFSFDEDVDKLREIITTTMQKHTDLIEGKPVQFWVSSMEDSYMKTSARCWTGTWDYWAVYWDQIEAIKKALEANDIKFAIPKTEVHYPEKLKAKSE